MRLAVAVDLVGEILEAPGLGLGDLAFILLDDFGGLAASCVDLSSGSEVLTRQEYMLVQSHALVLSLNADRWLVRADRGAPPAFFESPLTRGSGAHNAVGTESKACRGAAGRAGVEP